MVTRIHKNTVKAMIKRGKTFNGYISGNNVNSYHVNTGFCCGMPVSFSTIEEMEKTLTNFLYYLESELGNRAVFWVE